VDANKTALEKGNVFPYQHIDIIGVFDIFSIVVKTGLTTF